MTYGRTYTARPIFAVLQIFLLPMLVFVGAGNLARICWLSCYPDVFCGAFSQISCLVWPLVSKCSPFSVPSGAARVARILISKRQRGLTPQSIVSADICRRGR